MRQKFIVRHGFSLIELLVTIAIMAALLAFALPNYLGARERARDAKLKSELAQLKNALRMYYNDYQRFPAVGSSNGWPFKGCGAAGDTACDTATYGCTGFWFAAGGTDGCKTIYMKRPPTISTSNNIEARYYTKDNNNDFALCVNTLENTSDPEIAVSQKCLTAYSVAPAAAGTYCVCSDF